MTITTFTHQVEETIYEKGLLQHPFYQAWTAGRLTLDQLREYARQYYHFEAAFPTFLSAIHSRCDSLPVRQVILDNLWDEEHGPDNHPALWLRFCRALGLSGDEVVGSEATPETRFLVETYRELAQTRPYPEALAALFAYEVQAPAIAEQKMIGLRAFYGIDEPEALAFFAVHLEADVAHSGAERGVIEEHAGTPDERRAVVEAVRTARDALWTFLDGAYRDGALEPVNMEPSPSDVHAQP